MHAHRSLSHPLSLSFPSPSLSLSQDGAVIGTPEGLAVLAERFPLYPDVAPFTA